MSKFFQQAVSEVTQHLLLANFKHFDEMTCAHIETVLHKLSSRELVQLFLNTEASKLFAMSSVTKDLLGYLKKLEADIVVLKNVNKKFSNKSWIMNALEVVGIPTSTGDTTFEDKVYQGFRDIGVEVGESNIKPCYRVKKDKCQTIVKFSNRKDYLEILQKKKRRLDIEPAVLDLS